MKKMKNLIKNSSFWWKVIPLFGLMLWGLLSITNNLWYDEAYSASLISRSFSDLIAITARDDHSPFYYLLLKGFYQIFGGGDAFWSLKLFSLIFMVAYLGLGMFWVKRLFGEKISTYFMLVSILMPSMSVQATNVRMYAMGLFFLTATGLCAIEVYRNPMGKKWVVFALLSTCSVYCHTFSMIQTFLIYIVLLIALVYREVGNSHQRDFSQLKGYFGSGIFVAICFSPWLLVTYQQMLIRTATTGENVAAGRPNLYTLIDYCKDWFSAIETPSMSVMYFGMLIFLLLLFFAIKYMGKTKEYSAALGVGVVLTTTIIGALVSYYITPCFLGRYVFPGFGAFALMYSFGLAEIKSKLGKSLLLLLMFYCFIVQYKSELRLEYDSGLKEYQTFFEENIQEEDRIMASSAHTLFMSVYHPNREYLIYGSKSDRLPFLHTEAFTMWEQLESLEGELYYICFQGQAPDVLNEKYKYEEPILISYMYYDFAIYHMIKKE